MAWFWWLLLVFVVLLSLFVSFGNLAKVWACWRAKHAPRRLRVFLDSTFSFDGLLKNFHCHSVSPAGEVRGSIKAEKPLLTEEGNLEESAVALLLDSLTGFSLWSSGTIGFVTAELSFQLRGQVTRGDEMFVKAWVKQAPKMPEDPRLRKFAVLGFELFRAPGSDCDDPYTVENLIAEGEQLMVSIAPLAQQMDWNVQLLCPPYFERRWQAGMKTLASYAQQALPVEEISSLQKLAAVKMEGNCTSEAQLQMRQLNVNGVGHGAATASMLCLAVKDLTQRPVIEANFFYLAPAPAGTPVTLEIKQNATSDQVKVFMRNKGALLVRGIITVKPQMPAIVPGLRERKLNEPEAEWNASTKTVDTDSDTDSDSELSANSPTNPLDDDLPETPLETPEK